VLQNQLVLLAGDDVFSKLVLLRVPFVLDPLSVVLDDPQTTCMRSTKPEKMVPNFAGRNFDHGPVFSRANNWAIVPQRRSSWLRKT